MLLVGVTGGIACGKTEVCRVFRKRGAIILSGDQIGKEVVERNKGVLRQLVNAFGTEILNKNRTLNRRKLGRIAFASQESRDAVNNIIHPHLLRQLRKRIEDLIRKGDKDIVVVDAALIVEWGLQNELDYLIFVQSKKEDKIKRLRKQKAYSREEALDRIRSQLPEVTKRRLADFVIANDKGLSQLREKAESVWNELIHLAETRPP